MTMNFLLCSLCYVAGRGGERLTNNLSEGKHHLNAMEEFFYCHSSHAKLNLVIFGIGFTSSFEEEVNYVVQVNTWTVCASKTSGSLICLICFHCLKVNIDFLNFSREGARMVGSPKHPQNFRMYNIKSAANFFRKFFLY